MYIDTSHITRGGKTYTRHLLRESYRAHGKVLHRTIANLSQCSAAEIEAIRLALRHKEALENLGAIQDAITLEQGLSFGAVWTVYQVARRLGIEKALGTTREGKLALWQVMARVIDQGSRLSAVRLAMSHAACDVLGLDTSDEDALYENLDWLAEAQALVKVRFGVHDITFVGDRGMIKGQQIEELAQHGCHYITAITKPQIEKLLRTGTFQMDLFDQELAEVLADEGLRYVLRRNPVRAQEVRDTRQAKLATLQALVAKSNQYLTDHPRAKPQGAWQKLV